MNLAFPALFILLLVLPGVIFRKSSSLAGPFRRPRPFADELAESIIAAMLAHLLMVSAVQRLFGYEVNFRACLLLLLGEFSDSNAEGAANSLDAVVDATAGRPLSITFYFLGIYALSYLAGRGVLRAKRKFARHLRKYCEFFSDEPHARRWEVWEGLLTYDPNTNTSTTDPQTLAVLATVVEQGGNAVLYQGILNEIYWGDDGEPESFELLSAQRRDLDGDQEGFHEISGDRLVLRAVETRTLNMSFYRVRDPESAREEQPPERELQPDEGGVAGAGPEERPGA